MDNFSSLIRVPTTKMHKKMLLITLYLRKVREDISMFIATDKNVTDYYNFSDFFLKNKISDEGDKDAIKINTVNELTDLGYTLGYVFNQTGLIICEDDDSLNKNIWRSNLTFEKV